MEENVNVLYFELKLHPYDYAAASIILEEEGGRICQVDGKQITLKKYSDRHD